MATDKLRRKLKGWQAVSRNRHLVAEKYRLSDGEFRLLELYRDLTDWDKKHTDTFGTFDVVSSDVALLLVWDPGKVSRLRKKLLLRGLIFKSESGNYRVLNYAQRNIFDPAQIFLSDVIRQDSIAVPQHVIASVQKKIAPVQQDRGYTTNSPLVSFKVDSVSLIPCDKYLELEKSGRFGNLTADDMEFVEPSSREWELVRQRILAK